MKKYLKYIHLIIIVLFISSCANKSASEDEISLSSVEDAKSQDFAPTFDKPAFSNLSTDQKEAYQLRAIQKFKDFIDYIKIISNPKIAHDLKAHSVLVAQTLFVNDSIPLQHFLTNDSLSLIPLNNYLDSITTYKNPLIYTIETIDVTNELTKDTLNQYAGLLKVTLKNHAQTHTQFVAIHLVEIEKDFGNKDDLIPEIRLGKIN